MKRVVVAVVAVLAIVTVVLGVRFGRPMLDRIEASLKQSLRVATTQGHEEPDVNARANLILCFVIGRWQQFAKSGFKRSPLEHWDKQGQMIF